MGVEALGQHDNQPNKRGATKGHSEILFCILLLSAAQNKKIGDKTSVIELQFCRRTLTHGCNVKILVTETESHATIKNGFFFVD